VHWKVPVSSKILLIGNPINRVTVHYVQTEIQDQRYSQVFGFHASGVRM